ncbi:MAG: HAD family hydrolase [Ruminococcus sp.]|nr:HAD family hydrolase [Ruminococcus sp.]
MIKLIASDIDGTLLDDKKQLPPDFEQTLELVESKGASFVIASGRSYTALERQFGEYADRLSFICDNGAYIVYDGELISISIIPKETVVDVVKCCQQSGLIALLCGVKGTYYSSKSDVYNTEVRIYYSDAIYLDDLTSFDDDIFKIAVFEEGGIENHGNVILRGLFGDRLSVTLSGKYWTDLMNAGINKGEGLRQIQRKLGIGREESVAFGDFLNDIEMLESVEESYAMENAHERCKQSAKYIIGSNNDYAVTAEIKNLFK